MVLHSRESGVGLPLGHFSRFCILYSERFLFLLEPVGHVTNDDAQTWPATINEGL